MKKALNLPLLVFIVPWTIYFGIIWFNAVQVRPDGWYAAYLPHWGDGVAHLSYMAAFAYRNTFPSMHPLFYGHAFTYSFAADMLGGYLVKTGLPQWLVYNLWGFVLSVLSLLFIWYVVQLITLSKIQTFIVSTLFLTSGGLGWKYLILDRLHPQSVPASPFFPLLLTQRENTDIAWLNTIVGELIPQRAFLLAIPIGALLIMVWYRRFILHIAVNRYWLLLTGILFGLMPVIHPHTAMILAGVFVCWSLPDILYKSNWKDLLTIGIPAAIIGGFLTVQFLLPSADSTGFFKWYPGWLALSKNMNWLVFWWDNWGLFLPLALVGTIFFADRRLQRVLLPFWLWFILANLFLFQPYDWDNSKLLTWVYLFFAIPVTLCLVKTWRGKLPAKILTVVAFIALTLSGGYDAVRMLDTQTYALQIVSHEEIELATQFREMTSPNAVVLTSTTHRNWVPILTGRQILCGYLGWMWTYGIDASERDMEMKEMFAGSPLADKLLKQFNVSYVVIGPEERNEFTVNEAYFATRYPIFLQSSTTTVYKIK